MKIRKFNKAESLLLFIVEDKGGGCIARREWKIEEFILESGEIGIWLEELLEFNYIVFFKEMVEKIIPSLYQAKDIVFEIGNKRYEIKHNSDRGYVSIIKSLSANSRCLQHLELCEDFMKDLLPHLEHFLENGNLRSLRNEYLRIKKE